MKIKLIGQLHAELESLRLKPGDEIEAEPDPVSKVGGMHFTTCYFGHPMSCSIWPENYEIINPK